MEINYTPSERAAIDAALKNINDIINEVGGIEDELRRATPAERLRDPTSPEAVELEKIDAAGRDRLQPYIKQYQDLKAAAEARHFAAISGDPEKILEDARRRLPGFIETQYRAQVPTAGGSLVDYMIDNDLLLRTSAGVLLFHSEFIRALCNTELLPHSDALENFPEKHAELSKIIQDALKASRFVAFPKQTKTAVYRTKRRAGNITETPENLAVPTLPGYEYSTSFYHKDNSLAHLNLVPQKDIEMEFTNGEMSIVNGINKLNERSRVELEDLNTKSVIESIDLQNLRVFYNIILRDFERTGEIKDVYTVFVPQLLYYMGSDGRANKSDEKRAKKIVESYHNIIGVHVVGEDGMGAPRKKRKPVLLFEGDDEGKNTISFSSPYLKDVILSTVTAARTETERATRKGAPKKLYVSSIPSHTYMIKPEISKERSRAAIENVVLLVQGIAQAGGTGYHINGENLLSRNVQLSARLKTSKNKGQLLARVFSKTWKLLKEETTLTDNYKNVRISVNGSAPVLLSKLNPKDTRLIPTAATVSKMVIEIKHDGKVVKSQM